MILIGAFQLIRSTIHSHVLSLQSCVALVELAAFRLADGVGHFLVILRGSAAARRMTPMIGLSEVNSHDLSKSLIERKV